MEIIPKFHPSVPFYILMAVIIIGIVWAMVVNSITDRNLIKKLIIEIVTLDKADSLTTEEIKQKLKERHFCPNFNDKSLSDILVELVEAGKISSSMSCVIVGQNKYEYPVYSQITYSPLPPSEVCGDLKIFY